MDKLAEMTAFTEVARLGSFSAAARDLGLSPSAVSKLLTRMENRLGARLFNRTTRKLQLTESGEQFLERCLTILEQVETAEELLSGSQRKPAGQLVVSCSPGFAKHCLLPLIQPFLNDYPAVKLKLLLSGKQADIVSEGIDVAIRLGQLPDSSLVARKLAESRRIICASPSYLKAHGEPLTPDDLHAHNCLSISTSEHFNQWVLITKKGKQVIKASGNFVTDTVDALHQTALSGLGIVRLSEFMVGDDIASGRLIPLLEEHNREMQQIHAIYAHRRYVPGKVRVFIDFLLDQMAEYMG